MASRIFGVAVVAALLATAGAATAQSFTVTLEEDAPDSPASPGDSLSVPVTVILQGDEFSCAEDEEMPVNLTIGQGRALSGSADPGEVVLSNTMGIHNSATPAGEYNESGETTVTVQIAQTATSGEYELDVTGEFPGGNYGPPGGSCSGEFPSASGSTTIPVTVQGDDGMNGENPDDGDDGDDGADGGDGADGSDGSDGGDEENGLPLGPWMVPVALIGTAMALRGRQR